VLDLDQLAFIYVSDCAIAGFPASAALMQVVVMLGDQAWRRRCVFKCVYFEA